MFKNVSGMFAMLSLLGIFLNPEIASAHQPRIPYNNPVNVIDPEISKAYYGTLQGDPVTYRISTLVPFSLYVNVLVPDIAGQKKDVSAAIIKNSDTDHPVAVLEGINAPWQKFYEPFGADTYWRGPEYKAQVGPGLYEIKVWSSNNDSTYSLAIGEKESFNFSETLNALQLIPTIKQRFFHESPATFLLSVLAIGYVIFMFGLAFMIGFAYRWILNRMAKDTIRKKSHNIGLHDRLVRAAIALGLFFWSILTTWSPWLLFFSGIALFEAIFSWCGIYAALGRNTCPIIQ